MYIIREVDGIPMRFYAKDGETLQELKVRVNKHLEDQSNRAMERAVYDSKSYNRDYMRTYYAQHSEEIKARNRERYRKQKEGQDESKRLRKRNQELELMVKNRDEKIALLEQELQSRDSMIQSLQGKPQVSVLPSVGPTTLEVHAADARPTGVTFETGRVMNAEDLLTPKRDHDVDDLLKLLEEV